MPPAFEQTDTACGSFWRASLGGAVAADYEAVTPWGIHIGAGCARMKSRSDELGTIEIDGPCLTLLTAPPEGARFRTRLNAARRADSSGFWLPGELVESGSYSDELGRIVEATRQGRAVQVLASASPGLVARLITPVDVRYSGAARQLALQARAFDLLAAATAWLTGDFSNEPTGGGASMLVRRVDHAKDILDVEFAAPPTLDVLARRVGLNVRYLTEGFRARHGTTVARYVAERRLALAAELLDAGASVGQAAAAVGYSTPHFCTAFQRRFGMRPSEVRRRRGAPASGTDFPGT